jgi:hypothetical protein
MLGKQMRRIRLSDSIVRQACEKGAKNVRQGAARRMTAMMIVSGKSRAEIEL